MSVIDTHAHLEEIQDLEQALQEARAAGVSAVVAVGSDLPSNQTVLALAKSNKDYVFPALGLHPWQLGESKLDIELEFIAANMHEAVAVGEVGLDYSKKVRVLAEKNLQKQAFREVLKIARLYDKPVIVHSRYAWQDALSLVQESGVSKAVFHWYTGTSSVLRGIISGGYYISASPAVRYHAEHRRAVKEIGMDRLLLETDSPVVYQPGSESELRSRPSDVLKVLKWVAELRQANEAQVAEATTRNALGFFSIKT